MEPASPQIVFDTLTAYQRSAALKSAIELDLFSVIAGGAQTPAEIAGKCSVAERGARILCDFLVPAGFLLKGSDGYRLTDSAALFLVRSSPAYLGSMANFLNSTRITEAFATVTEAVRRGGAVVTEEGTLSVEDPIWVEFARAMGPMAAFSAQLIAHEIQFASVGPSRILDIAAGHGQFGITLASVNPEATVLSQDWANVLRVAEENAQAAGLGSRFATLPGSAFDVDFGTGHDIVLVTNFLHHFDPPTCEKLLRKVHASLKPGGRALTVEFVPDDQRTSPATMFGLVMLVSTPSGDAYTYPELEVMMRNAGFAHSEKRQLGPTPQTLIVSYKD